MMVSTARLAIVVDRDAPEWDAKVEGVQIPMFDVPEARVIAPRGLAAMTAELRQAYKLTGDLSARYAILREALEAIVDDERSPCRQHPHCDHDACAMVNKMRDIAERALMETPR